MRSKLDACVLIDDWSAVNQRDGRGAVLVVSAGLAGERRAWSMKQERKTPGYTNCWAELPVVRA